MTSSLSRAVITAAAAVLMLAASCAKSAEPRGTNTNWLKPCVDHSECGDYDVCACGLCTRSCSTSDQCEDLGESARCEAFAQLCGEPAAPSACAQGCDSDEDCDAVQGGARCMDGACVREAGPVADGSVPPDAFVPPWDGSVPMTDGGPQRPDAGLVDGGTTYALWRDGMNVEITPVYTACEADADCAVVSTQCSCCGKGAVRSDLVEIFRANAELACNDYQGPVCRCAPKDLVARCESGRCVTRERCAPQEAYFTDVECESNEALWVWNAWSCMAVKSCVPCSGPDCDAVFDSLEACMATYQGCQTAYPRCAGWDGSTCSEDEYCFFPSCGVVDGSGVCLPLPTACQAGPQPACSCAGETVDLCDLPSELEVIWNYGPCL